MDLAELKKEYAGRFVRDDDIIFSADYVWRWFSSKIESTLLALKNLQVQYLEANEYIEKLKKELAEHEKQRDFWHTEIQREHKEVEELTTKLAIKDDALDASQIAMNEMLKQLADAKAENEKLSAQVNGKELKDLESVKEIIRLNVAEARQEERARIVEQIKADDYSVTVISEQTEEPQQITAMINDSLNDYREHLATELSKAITADQPTQKSCEGCEHLKHNLFIGAPYCTEPCKAFSNYQARK